MLAKNTRASVATVAVALITGLMVALWVALMPAPAQALIPGPGGGVGTTQCSDKKDNDGDKLIDYGNDPGCTSLSDNTESPNPSMTPSNAEKDRVVFKRVQVQANREYIHTGVTLHDGDELRITATGTMKPNWSGGEYDCNGWADHPARSDWPLPGKPEYGLIGALQGSQSSGNHIYYFWVGCRLPASPNGTWVHQGDPQALWLGINDAYVGDNTGYFQATIEVFRERQPQPQPKPTTPDTGTTTPGTGTTNTPPKIDPIKPVTGSKIRNRSPLIAAMVSDADTDLAQSNIKLFVDGKSITNFSYDAAKDRLSYRSGKLAYGGHTVKVKATDAAGLEGKKTWRFKVVKR
jgi:hypothetical protein